jgi:hypothetical protein
MQININNLDRALFVIFCFMCTDIVATITKQGLTNALHITPGNKKEISILHNVSGIIKPHR